MSPEFRLFPCESCASRIIWAVTDKGVAIPVDPSPAVDGNIVLERREFAAPRAHMAKKADRVGRTDLYVSHFATCPNADRHRKSGK